MDITHNVDKLLLDIRSAPAGSTEMYRLIDSLAGYLREAEKDATAWRLLADSALDGHVYVVGHVDIPQPVRGSAYRFEAPPAEYFSVERTPVKQAVFRWFGDGDLRDALIDMVAQNDRPQKS